MDIIGSWVDEKLVRTLAIQLTTPYQGPEPSEASDDDDFIILGNDETFMDPGFSDVGQQEIPPRAMEDVDSMVAKLTDTAPVYSEEKAQQVAAKAQEVEVRKAVESEVVAERFGTVADLDEEKGWGAQQGVAPEPSQSRENTGGISARQVFSSTLDQLIHVLSSQWGCQRICISDRDGDVFFDSIANPAWTMLTVSMTKPIRALDIKEGAAGHGYMHLRLSAKEILQVVVASTSHGLIVLGMILEKQLNADQAKILTEQIRKII